MRNEEKWMPLLKQKMKYSQSSKRYRDLREQIMKMVLTELSGKLFNFHNVWRRGTFTIDDAAEAQSIIFMSMMKAIDTYIPNSKTKFSSYLWNIVNHEFSRYADYMTRGKRNSLYTIPFNPQSSSEDEYTGTGKIVEEEHTPEPIVKENLDAKLLHETMVKVATPLQKALIKGILDGYTIAEVARMHNISSTAVKNQFEEIVRKTEWEPPKTF